MEELKKIVEDYLMNDCGLTDVKFSHFNEEDKEVVFGTSEGDKLNGIGLGSEFTSKGVELDITSKLEPDFEDDVINECELYVSVKLYDEKDFHRTF